MLDGTVVATGEKVAVAIDITGEMIKRAAVTLFELENPRNIGRWDDVPAFRRRLHLDDAEAVLRSALQGKDRVDG